MTPDPTVAGTETWPNNVEWGRDTYGFKDATFLVVPVLETDMFVRCPACDCRHFEYRAREKGHCYNCGKPIGDVPAVEESKDPLEFKLPPAIVDAILRLKDEAQKAQLPAMAALAGEIANLRASERELKTELATARQRLIGMKDFEDEAREAQRLRTALGAEPEEARRQLASLLLEQDALWREAVEAERKAQRLRTALEQIEATVQRDAASQMRSIARAALEASSGTGGPANGGYAHPPHLLPVLAIPRGQPAGHTAQAGVLQAGLVLLLPRRGGPQGGGRRDLRAGRPQGAQVRGPARRIRSCRQHQALIPPKTQIPSKRGQMSGAAQSPRLTVTGADAVDRLLGTVAVATAVTQLGRGFFNCSLLLLLVTVTRITCLRGWWGGLCPKDHPRFLGGQEER